MYYFCYIHFDDILVKLKLFNGIICIFIIDFVFLTPLLCNFCPFCYLYQNLVTLNYLITPWFVLFLLPIKLYDILVKLELRNGIICIFIVDFCFLALFRDLFPFCHLYQTLEPRNYLRIPWYVLFLLPITFMIYWWNQSSSMELFSPLLSILCFSLPPLCHFLSFCEFYQTLLPQN